MPHSSSSALVTKQGERVLLRIAGNHYDLDHLELRKLLDLPAGAPGLGITIDNDRFSFEFTDHSIEMSSKQLVRRLRKLATTDA